MEWTLSTLVYARWEEVSGSWDEMVEYWGVDLPDVCRKRRRTNVLGFVQHNALAGGKQLGIRCVD